MEVHRHLDEELDYLRDSVLRLGGEAETALRRAMESLMGRDSAAARAVLDHDDEIDQLEVEVDRQCVDIFALRQPAARDLRFVMSVAKMAPVLERIADHACNIARAALDETPLFFPQLRFTALGDFQGIMPHSLDVECDVQWQEVGEGINGQPIRNER